MSASVDPVTARYADALFELAREKGALDAVQKDVERLAVALAEPELDAALADARVSAVQKRERLRSLSRSFHALTKNFLELVFDKRRERVLHGLGAAFRRRVLVSRGAVEGVAHSARPLGQPELSSLAAHLSSVLGKEVLLENRITPELVGGVRVLVDNRLLDQSVVGRLEGLRRRLKASRLPVFGS